MKRRDFLKKAGAGLAVGAVGMRAAPARAADNAYIDVHVHIGREFALRKPLTVGELLRWMDRRGVAQACVLPLVNPESWDHPVTTEYVLEQTEPHRDRLIPFCSIDPRTVNLSGFEEKRDLFRKYRDAGAMGFGEHKPGVAIDDERNVVLFRAAAEVGLPILFHLDSVRNFDKPGLPGLESVLQQVPEGIFIGHAQGFWASISGDASANEMQGYPKGNVAPGGALDRLMDAYPNLYGDVSAGSGANAIMRDMNFGRDFVIRRADRLLFGTDFLRPQQEIPQFNLYETLDLPPEVEGKLYRDNARRVLGLG